MSSAIAAIFVSSIIVIGGALRCPFWVVSFAAVFATSMVVEVASMELAVILGVIVGLAGAVMESNRWRRTKG